MALCLTDAEIVAANDEKLSPEEAMWIREHVGIYAWEKAGEAELRDYTRVERAQIAKRLGTHIIRDAVPAYQKKWRRRYDPRFIVPLDFLRQPGWRYAIDLFDVIVFTMSDGSGRFAEHDWTAPQYRAVTEYLLRTYSNTPKTFILGMWEGDHWLKEPEKAIPFFHARHDGIIAGRQAVPNSRSKVYEMIELVSLDFNGKMTLVNNSVPQTNADLYSLSSWGYQDELIHALDYIKTKAPDSPDFGEKNCMIGEAGGRCNSFGEKKRIKDIHRILTQAREWGVPYVTWWELEGSDFGLLDAKFNGGRKFAPYYYFYRAYHYNDDPMLIDDFEADPLGLPDGDFDVDGYSINCLGGRREIIGDGVAAAVMSKMGDSPAFRSLLLRFAKETKAGSGWRTELTTDTDSQTLTIPRHSSADNLPTSRQVTTIMEFDARRFTSLCLSVRGETEGLAAVLTDSSNNAVKTEITKFITEEKRNGWRIVVIPLKIFGDSIDISQLASFALVASELGDERTVYIDTLRFTSDTDRRLTPSYHAPALSPKASHIMLHSSPQSLDFFDKRFPSVQLSQIRLVPSRGARLIEPTLTDGKITLKLAEELRAGTTLTLNSNGTSHLRFGPMREYLDVTNPDAAGVHTVNLSGHPRYHSFQPTHREGPCYLEWRYASPYPIRHFRITLYGGYNHDSQAEAKVLVSNDGKHWLLCPLRKREWDEDFWLATPPNRYEPTSKFWVRLQIQPDMKRKDWQWTIGISDFKIDLWLDTAQVQFPQISELHYSDKTPAISFRGLLSLDW